MRALIGWYGIGTLVWMACGGLWIWLRGWLRKRGGRFPRFGM